MSHEIGGVSVRFPRADNPYRFILPNHVFTLSRTHDSPNNAFFFI